TTGLPGRFSSLSISPSSSLIVLMHCSCSAMLWRSGSLHPLAPMPRVMLATMQYDIALRFIGFSSPCFTISLARPTNLTARRSPSLCSAMPWHTPYEKVNQRPNEVHKEHHQKTQDLIIGSWLIHEGIDQHPEPKDRRNDADNPEDAHQRKE